MPHILALDEGTTSARAILFDEHGAIRSVAQKEFAQHFPQSGWVEHDAEEIWTTQLAVAVEAMRGLNDVAAIGITNQRETTVVWDRESGKPVCNAIVWQDRRTAPLCAKLRADGCEALIRERTGLVIDAYFSGSKIAWILDNVTGTRARAEAGKLAFGTIDSWLVWKLTGGKTHVTDASNASRTMLFNIRTGQWDDELLKLLKIPRSMLPDVRSSSEIYAEASIPELAGIPIAGMAGDQQAALFGQLCLLPGQTKTTYGTGCFMLQNTGTSPVASKNRLLTTVANRMGGTTSFALEGSVFVGGAVVQWLRDGLGIIKSSAEIEQLATSVPDSGGVCMVPAFTGLGAPHWDANARGLIIGITRGTTKAHIARAALESIAFQVADLFDAMNADAGLRASEMRVDGGAANDDFLMHFQADLLGVPLVRPTVSETTALGAAYLAGLAVGVWKRPEDLISQQQIAHKYEPRGEVSRVREQWHRALERAKDWDRGETS